MITQSGRRIDSCRSVILARLADVLVRDCSDLRAIPVSVVCARGSSATELRRGPAGGEWNKSKEDAEE